MTQTPEQLIRQQYIALAKLLKAYQTPSTDIQLIRDNLAFCQSLYKLANSQPNLVFAQPQLYKTQLPYWVNLSFNACVFSCLIAIRNRFDPNLCIQLMCSTISVFARSHSQIKAYHLAPNHRAQILLQPQPKAMANLLIKYRQNIWQLSDKACSNKKVTQQSYLQTLSPESAVCYFAQKLALLCTPNKTGLACTFAAALKRLTLQTSSGFYALLSPLVAYPGLIPPGSYVKDNQQTIQLVLALHPSGLVCQKLATNTQPSKASDSPPISLIKDNAIKQQYPCQALKRLVRLNLYWGEAFNTWCHAQKTPCTAAAFPSVPIGKAPASLLVLQDQLKAAQTDIQLVVKAISNEPEYVQQLLSSASISNRQKQAVHNLQQAIAMLGFERCASILLQHALLARLNQSHFPLQQKFYHFTQLTVFIAKELSKTYQPDAMHMMGDIVYFLLSRLFTLASQRTLNHWYTEPSNTYSVEGLIKGEQAKELKSGAIKLAHAWQQPELILTLLKQHDLPLSHKANNQQLALLTSILSASLSMANEIYFSKEMDKSPANSRLSEVLDTLSLSAPQWTKLTQSLAAKSGVFCPLF
ncbi:HDOD domain-containing protein [Paraglaciecola aestuariivivens]